MEERFERFWKAYPRKESKGDARKAFAKVNPSDALLDQMLVSIAASAATHQWQKDHGGFIPLPATWLNGQRWLDEVRPDRGIPDQKQHPPNTQTRFHNFEERDDGADQETAALTMATLRKHTGGGMPDG